MPHFDLLCGLHINHVAAIFVHLIMQRLRSVAEKAAVLVSRAALNGNIAPERDKGGLKLERVVNDAMIINSGILNPRASNVQELGPSGCALAPY